MIRLHWHGYKAGLDGRGTAAPPARGIESLKKAGITHVGVPQHHSGQWGDYNYIENLVENGFKIIRTIEQPYNAGLKMAYPDGEIDLGRVIMEYIDPQRCGRFFDNFVDNLQTPCDGIGWNLEHNVLNALDYPVTTKDIRCAQWRTFYDPDESLHSFRCWQFSVIFAMYRAVAEYHLGRPMTMIGYSGYERLEYNHTSLRKAYGCDWSMQQRPLMRGHTALWGIDYAMCSYPVTDLPKSALATKHSLPILHTLNCIPDTSPGCIDWKNTEKAMRDRSEKMRNGDGFGMVCSNMKTPWNEDDDRLCAMVASLG